MVTTQKTDFHPIQKALTHLLRVDHQKDLDGYLNSTPVLTRFDQLTGDTCGGIFNILGLEYNLAEELTIPDISIGFHPDQLVKQYQSYPEENWYPSQAEHAIHLAADWNRNVPDNLSLYFEYDYDRYKAGVTDPGLYFSFSTGGPYFERVALISELLPAISDHPSVDKMTAFLNKSKAEYALPNMAGRMFSRNDPGFRFSFLPFTSDAVRAICEAFGYPGDTDELVHQFKKLSQSGFYQVVMMIQFDDGMLPVIGFECFYRKKEQDRYRTFCETLPEFGLPDIHPDYKKIFKPTAHRFEVPGTFWTQRAIRMISHVKMVFDGEKMTKSKIYYRIIYTH